MARRRLARGALCCLLAVVVGGCTSATMSSAPPVPSAPTVTAGVLPMSCRGDDPGAPCISDVAAAVERDAAARADGAVVTHAHVLAALTPLVQALRNEVRVAHSYELLSPLGDDDVEAKATTPLRTSWQLGRTSQDLWACFRDGRVRIVPSPCDGASA